MNFKDTLYLTCVICFSLCEYDVKARKCFTEIPRENVHDFKIEFNESQCMWFAFREMQTYSPFTVASCFHVEGKRKRRKLKCDALHTLYAQAKQAFTPYQTIHSSTVQLASTTHHKDRLCPLFALIHPASHNTSSISKLRLETFLNRIQKSAIMKHYVIVSISLSLELY